MVLAEEFGDWEDSRRRIDLLCLDPNAQLIVVELKRTVDGGHMELQALRYSAMVSTGSTCDPEQFQALRMVLPFSLSISIDFRSLRLLRNVWSLQ